MKDMTCVSATSTYLAYAILMSTGFVMTMGQNATKDPNSHNQTWHGDHSKSSYVAANEPTNFSGGEREPGAHIPYMASDFPVQRMHVEGRGTSLVMDENDAGYPTVDDMLDFMQKNMVTYGEDIMQDCVDEADVKKLIDTRYKALYDLLKKMFIMMVALFAVFFLTIVGILIYLWRKNSPKPTIPVLTARYSRRKLTNESDSVQEQYSHVCRDLPIENDQST